MKPFKEHWEQIIHWYDFNKVKTTMDALEWKWGNSIPKTGEIVELARDLCEEAYTKKTMLSTGGFKAEYNEKEDILSLEFIVENWKTEYWD